MPENRNSVKLESAGALTTGVKDRWEATYTGEIVGLGAVVGTAPAGSALILNLLKNGTPLFPLTVGTVYGSSTAQASTGGIDASQTYVDISLSNLSGAGGPVAGGLEAGVSLLIDSEQLLVVDFDPNTAGNQNTQTGSPQGSGVPVTRVAVARAQNGTVAAVHNANAAVKIARPQINAGSTSIASGSINVVGGQFVAGDVFSLNVDQIGSGTAGSDLDVSIEYVAD